LKKKILLLLIFFICITVYAQNSSKKVTVEVKDINNKIKKMVISPVRTKGKTILYNLYKIDKKIFPKAVLFRLVKCEDGIKKLEVLSKKWRKCNIIFMSEPENTYLNSYRYIKSYKK